jgi:hypothetical protein
MVPPYVFLHKVPDLVLPVRRVTRQMVEKNVIWRYPPYVFSHRVPCSKLLVGPCFYVE